MSSPNFRTNSTIFQPQLTIRALKLRLGDLCSDLKVHVLHYANELIVRVRLSYQTFLPTHQKSKQANYTKLSKTGFSYD